MRDVWERLPTDIVPDMTDTLPTLASLGLRLLFIILRGRHRRRRRILPFLSSTGGGKSTKPSFCSLASLTRHDRCRNRPSRRMKNDQSSCPAKVCTAGGGVARSPSVIVNECIFLISTKGDDVPRLSRLFSPTNPHQQGDFCALPRTNAPAPKVLFQLRLKARPARLALRDHIFHDSATLTWKTSNWLDIALASENQGIVTAHDRLDELMPLCSLLGLFCLSGNACKGPKFTRNSA